MPEQAYIKIICDSPWHQKESEAPSEIDPKEHYVNAMTYGATFHIDCFRKLTSIELCKALGLDEVEVIKPNNQDYNPARERVWTALR